MIDPQDDIDSIMNRDEWDDCVKVSEQNREMRHIIVKLLSENVTNKRKEVDILSKEPQFFTTAIQKRKRGMSIDEAEDEGDDTGEENDLPNRKRVRQSVDADETPSAPGTDNQQASVAEENVPEPVRQQEDMDEGSEAEVMDSVREKTPQRNGSSTDPRDEHETRTLVSTQNQGESVEQPQTQDGADDQASTNQPRDGESSGSKDVDDNDESQDHSVPPPVRSSQSRRNLSAEMIESDEDGSDQETEADDDTVGEVREEDTPSRSKNQSSQSKKAAEMPIEVMDDSDDDSADELDMDTFGNAYNSNEIWQSDLPSVSDQKNDAWTIFTS